MRLCISFRPHHQSWYCGGFAPYSGWSLHPCHPPSYRCSPSLSRCRPEPPSRRPQCIRDNSGKHTLLYCCNMTHISPYPATLVPCGPEPDLAHHPSPPRLPLARQSQAVLAGRGALVGRKSRSSGSIGCMPDLPTAPERTGPDPLEPPEPPDSPDPRPRVLASLTVLAGPSAGWSRSTVAPDLLPPTVLISRTVA